LIIDFGVTFGTENGKRVLAQLRKLTTYNRSSILPNSEIDVNRLIYDEGQRVVIIYIDNMLAKIPGEKRQLKARD